MAHGNKIRGPLGPHHTGHLRDGQDIALGNLTPLNLFKSFWLKKDYGLSRRAGGRCDGGQEDPGSYSHVPSDSPHQRRYLIQRRTSAGSGRPLLDHDFGDGQNDRADRGGNGSDDRCLGGGAHDLRYVQSHRSRDEFQRRLFAREVWWQVRPIYKENSQ